MSLTAAASGFVVLLLSLQVTVQSQDGWEITFTSSKICAPTGSTVEMSCSYRYQSGSYPSITVQTFWFTEMNHSDPVDLTTDSEYKDRVQYNCTNNFCTLRISDLRKSDSAEYKFRLITNQQGGKFTGEPGVTLTVTDLQVSTPYVRELQCDSSCRPPSGSYVWYEKGKEIWNKKSYLDTYYEQQSYSCALKGYEDYPSPSVCVSGPNCYRLTYTDINICAFKGSSVNISCTYNKYNHRNASTFWFRRENSDVLKNPEPPEDLQVNSQYEGRAEVETVRGRSTLTLSNLTESDSAKYHFKFKTPNSDWNSFPGTILTVTGLQVTRVNQSGATVELRCLSHCLPVYPFFIVWIKNGEKFSDGETFSFNSQLNSGDVISCALKGLEQFPSPSVYAPKLPSVSVSSSEMMEGSSVTLTCSSDAKPAASYTWYKEKGNLNRNPPRTKKKLVLKLLQSSDSGEYFCTAENQLGSRTSENIVIDVKYAPKLPSVSMSPSEIVEGSSVNLTCSSDANPAANYTWYKEDQTLPQGPKNLYLFSSISSKDSGMYHCKSENKYGEMNSTSVHVDVQYAPKLPSVSVSPSAEKVEGSTVNLTCSSDANPAANYTWYKENSNTHLPVSKGPQFVLSSIQPSDSGDYYCAAENKLGRTSGYIFIDVTYAPQTCSVSVSPSAEIVEGSSMTLTCSSDANPAANYTWYKENEDSPKASGQIFTITDFRAEHSGNYSCEAQNQLGHKNSTIRLSLATGKTTIVIVVFIVTLVVLILIVFLLLCRCMRKKKALFSFSEPNDPVLIVRLDSGLEYQNFSALKSMTAAKTEDKEEQEDQM